MTSFPAKTSTARSLLIWAAIALLPPVTLLASAAPASFVESLQEGKVSLDVRLRYEDSTFPIGDPYLGGVRRGASALTAGSRLSFVSHPASDWQYGLSLANSTIVTADDDPPPYTLISLNPYTETKVYPYHHALSDVECTRLNEAWVSRDFSKTKLTLGRQRLALANERFIGGDDWHLIAQTFDAAVAQDSSIDHLSLTYAYIWRVNRATAPLLRSTGLHSDSHVFFASYDASRWGQLSTYAYLLDIAEASSVDSTATYGLAWDGRRELTSQLALTGHVEYATQRPYRTPAHPWSYASKPAPDYRAAEVSLVASSFQLAVGGEQRTRSESGIFSTPLGSNHNFNGWSGRADSGRPNSLRDLYVRLDAELPGRIRSHFAWHQLRSGGTYAALAIPESYDYFASGRVTEFNGQLSRQLFRSLTATIALAHFDSTQFVFPGGRKLWLQLDYSY